ncbi:MAG: KpsF/GutQ family sugar-phosphate isomerase [Chthonomonadetes bacterium]|nr:KpsF/GutQ family sugar-phosphate isomerase [Chthonomonadetes bacterium]
MIEVAREVLHIEAQSILRLVDRLDERFEKAVQVILSCKGRVVTTGMGKSGAIARKVSATFASTGTPAFFLHPAEGVHGDLGMVTAEDVVLALSTSGETDELLAILPALKRIGVRLIAMVGRVESTLAQAADVVLDVSVEREACPYNLAPTASTTAMLAMGDALAITVMQERRFTPEDFAVFHPAGTLGRRLLLRVHDVMRTGDSVAIVHQGQPLRDVLFAITRANAGAACIVDDRGVLVGIITDGDIRRHLLRDVANLDRPAEALMTRTPHVVRGNPLAVEALHLFESLPQKIGEMPVLDEEGKPVGMLMLKDLLRTGIV